MGDCWKTLKEGGFPHISVGGNQGEILFEVATNVAKMLDRIDRLEQELALSKADGEGSERAGVEG